MKPLIIHDAYTTTNRFMPCSSKQKEVTINWSGDNRWYYCREQFHRSMRPKKDFSFLFSHADIQKVKDFITAIETKFLKLKKLTTFRDTNKENVVQIIPSKFWTQQRIRFTLLTILLRSNLTEIDPANIRKDALLKHILRHNTYLYTDDLRESVRKFLNGCYWYNGKKYRGGYHLWQFVFQNGTETEKLNRKKKNEAAKCIANKSKK